MNRNTRTIIVMIVALLVAGAASYAVLLAVQRMSITAAQAPQAQTVVAAKPLPIGTLVTAEHVKLLPWPAGTVIPGSFTSIDQVTNRGLVQSVSENEPLTESKLGKVGAGAGLPPTIPPGMRALSVRVNEVVGVAGFVVPGNRVDVLVSINPGQSGGQAAEPVTRVIVSNVQVLTAGTRYDQQEAQPIPTSVVTLLLTPEDAERVTLAADEGRIMLTLRNPLDVEPTKTTGVRRGSLFTGEAPPAVQRPPGPARRAPQARAAAPPPPVSRAYTVETIRAAKRAEETVR